MWKSRNSLHIRGRSRVEFAKNSNEPRAKWEIFAHNGNSNLNLRFSVCMLIAFSRLSRSRVETKIEINSSNIKEREQPDNEKVEVAVEPDNWQWLNALLISQSVTWASNSSSRWSPLEWSRHWLVVLVELSCEIFIWYESWDPPLLA